MIWYLAGVAAATKKPNKVWIYWRGLKDVIGRSQAGLKKGVAELAN